MISYIATLSVGLQGNVCGFKHTLQIFFTFEAQGKV